MSEDNNNSSVSSTDMESNPLDATLSAYGFETLATRVHITVSSYRWLNHDPDGISAKAVLDALVKGNILADDSSKQVESITFKSFKSRSKEEEETIIEIEIV